MPACSCPTRISIHRSRSWAAMSGTSERLTGEGVKGLRARCLVPIEMDHGPIDEEALAFEQIHVGLLVLDDGLDGQLDGAPHGPLGAVLNCPGAQ